MSNPRPTLRAHKRTRYLQHELLIPSFQWWNKRNIPGSKTPDSPLPLLIPSSIWNSEKPHYFLPVKIIHDRQQSVWIYLDPPMNWSQKLLQFFHFYPCLSFSGPGNFKVFQLFTFTEVFKLCFMLYLFVPILPIFGTYFVCQTKYRLSFPRYDCVQRDKVK